ncbi:MAG: hypothetical protein ACJ75B_12165 [Flavisolibacter sp.]
MFLVHGEYEVQKAFTDRLELKGFKRIEIPGHHQSFHLKSESVKEQAA